jgi:type VI secretion system protein ImpJ
LRENGFSPGGGNKTVKLLSKIVWAEGMYLGPHHFQAQNRYFEEAVHFATTRLWRHAYGFAACQVDAEALRNGTVKLLHARGIFEDGLLFDIPECDAPPGPLNIAAEFHPTADSLMVSLAVPRWFPDQQNCTLEATLDGDTRYTRVEEILHDENTGRDEKPVQIGRKNIRLLLEMANSGNLVTLPIARVIRDGTGHFVFDPTFVPPSIRFSASERLAGMLERLVEILDEKSAIVMQEQRHVAGKFQAGMSARQVSQFWFLHAINSSLTSLRHLLLSKHGHPEELFCEMSRLAGVLCTFGMDAHPRSLPPYNHRDPGPGFDQLDEHIRRHLEIIAPSQAITIPLKAVHRYFYEGEVKDQRCLGRARWILAIHSPVGEADLISKTLRLVKVCSAKFVQELVKRALPGLTLSHVAVPPSAIPAKVDSQYFAISRSGPCWEHIMQTHVVSVYVPGELPSPEVEMVVILEE